MLKNQALSDFLVARRAAITPDMVGITTSGNRRVAGLRREEVADLAAVSADWYVRLEQGRQVTPSESVLASIASVLQLDDAERAYLFNLARPTSGAAQAPAKQAQTVRPGIARMLGGFVNQPAFVLGPRMEVLAGNELAWALLEDFPARDPDDRNLLRWIVTDPRARRLYLDWEVIASELCGVLQLEASARPQDPRIADLVDELSTKSPEFAAWWTRPNPQGRTSGVKRFNHAVVGQLRIDWEAFDVPDDPSQTLFIYSASDDASEDALRELAAWRAALTGSTAPVNFSVDAYPSVNQAAGPVGS